MCGIHTRLPWFRPFVGNTIAVFLIFVNNKKTPAGKEKISAAKEKENVKAQVSKKAVTALPVTRKDTAASSSKNVAATMKKIVAAIGSKTGRPGKRS